MKNYYIIDDVWDLIKTYMFHSIKIHGKHLKKDKNVFLYNEVVKSVPIITIPRGGPRIIYNSAKRKFRVAKFLYYGKELKSKGTWPRYNSVIEYVPLNQFKPDYYTIFGMDFTTKRTVSWYYHKNLVNVKSKLT
jgi:hypothetical protein